MNLLAALSYVARLDTYATLMAVPYVIAGVSVTPLPVREPVLWVSSTPRIRMVAMFVTALRVLFSIVVFSVPTMSTTTTPCLAVGCVSVGEMSSVLHYPVI